MTIPLLILTLISAAGLLLFFFKKVNTTGLNLLIALGAGSMIAISLVHIFPETIEQTEYAIYAFLAGFVIIYIIEELFTPHRHDHTHGDHSHEDPHEHYDHIAVVSFIAIFCHTLLDGLGIRAGMWLSEAVWYMILFGVAIHQIPVSLSLAAILRSSKLTQNTQITLLVFFALAAPIGYILSDMILSHVDMHLTGLAAAFAGGSLLYVAASDLLPMIHAQTQKKYFTIPAFILGVAIMSLLASHHHHEHHDQASGHTAEHEEDHHE